MLGGKSKKYTHSRGFLGQMETPKETDAIKPRRPAHHSGAGGLRNPPRHSQAPSFLGGGGKRGSNEKEALPSRNSHTVCSLLTSRATLAPSSWALVRFASSFPLIPESGRAEHQSHVIPAAFGPAVQEIYQPSLPGFPSSSFGELEGCH